MLSSVNTRIKLLLNGVSGNANVAALAVPDMSLQHFQNQSSQSRLAESLDQVPQTFAETIAHIQMLALEDFDREIAAKQLCYHTREHVEGVQRRARQLFQAVYPYLGSAF
jgi:hypothetical protein